MQAAFKVDVRLGVLCEVDCVAKARRLPSPGISRPCEPRPYRPLLLFFSHSKGLNTTYRAGVSCAVYTVSVSISDPCPGEQSTQTCF